MFTGKRYYKRFYPTTSSKKGSYGKTGKKRSYKKAVYNRTTRRTYPSRHSGSYGRAPALAKARAVASQPRVSRFQSSDVKTAPLSINTSSSSSLSAPRSLGRGRKPMSRYSKKRVGVVRPAKFNGHAGCRVSHTEYLTDIRTGALSGGSTAFAITRFNVNPGLPGSFPWLSGIAANYEQARPVKVHYRFRTTCGDAFSSSNNSLGTVILATAYNSDAPTFTTKIAMENYLGAISTKPSRTVVHRLDCSKNDSPLDMLYVRADEVPDGQSPQFYDFASFFIATQGMQAAGVNIGELWVDYEYEFAKPRFNGNDSGDTALWRLSFVNFAADPPYLLGSPVVQPGTDLALRWGGAPPAPAGQRNDIIFPQKPLATRYVINLIYTYTQGNQVALVATDVPWPAIDFSFNGSSGITQITNFWGDYGDMVGIGGPVFTNSDNTNVYPRPVVMQAGGVHAPTFTYKIAINVAPFVIGQTNLFTFTMSLEDPAIFNAAWPTPNGWTGTLLVTTVPNTMHFGASLGAPAGPLLEPEGCVDQPSSFLVPLSLKGALQVCELNQYKLEGKEEKSDDPSDDEKDEEDEVVPSKRNRFQRSFASANLRESRREMKALSDANALLPDDEDEPEPLPDDDKKEEKKDKPKSSLLSLLQTPSLSMPPPSGLSTSSSLSTPPPGATVITPRTIKRGWF